MFSSAAFRYALAVAIVTLITTGSFANAQNETNSTNPWSPPEQGIARLTGYPAWHGLRKGWNMEIIDASTLFSIIGTTVAAGLALRYGQLTGDHSQLNKQQRALRLFINVISWYNIATLITVTGFLFVDIGKLWTNMGVLHNLSEVAILLTLMFQGHVRNFKYFYGIQLIYITLVVSFVFLLPWPLDALFFKLQGLIIDYVLVIQFTRLYKANKAAEYLPHGPRHGLAASLLANDEHLETGNDITEEIVGPEHRLESDSIKILIVASAIHLAGSIVGTLFVDDFWPFVFFQFTYAVTFPLYGFYVLHQPVVSKAEIKWIKTTWCSEILVALFGTLLSFITVAITVWLVFGKN